MTMTDAARTPGDLAPVPTEPRPGRVAVLLGIGLTWLAALLWTMRSALADSGGADSALIFAAQNLFGPVTAALAVGCATGLTAMALVTAWRAQRLSTHDSSTGPAAQGPGSLAQRLAIGFGSGLVTGVASGGVILVAIEDRNIAAVYAVCLTAAATLGGLLSSIPLRGVLAAGIGGTYITFLTKAVLTPFTATLAPFFGADKTLEANNAAGNRLLLAFSLVAGIGAGVFAHRSLRRGRPAALRWPHCLVAGGFAGLLALLAEAFTRLSAVRLLSPLTDLSVVERTVLSLNGSARINAGMVLLFAGALTTLVLFGRGLKQGTTASSRAPRASRLPRQGRSTDQAQ